MTDTEPLAGQISLDGETVPERPERGATLDEINAFLTEAPATMAELADLIFGRAGLTEARARAILDAIIKANEKRRRKNLPELAFPKPDTVNRGTDRINNELLRWQEAAASAPDGIELNTAPKADAASRQAATSTILLKLTLPPGVTLTPDDKRILDAATTCFLETAGKPFSIGAIHRKLTGKPWPAEAQRQAIQASLDHLNRVIIDLDTERDAAYYGRIRYKYHGPILPNYTLEVINPANGQTVGGIIVPRAPLWELASDRKQVTLISTDWYTAPINNTPRNAAILDALQRRIIELRHKGTAGTITEKWLAEQVPDTDTNTRRARAKITGTALAILEHYKANGIIRGYQYAGEKITVTPQNLHEKPVQSARKTGTHKG